MTEMCKNVQTQYITEWETKDRWHSCKKVLLIMNQIISYWHNSLRPRRNEAIAFKTDSAMKPLILRWIPSGFIAWGLDLDQMAKILTMRPSTMIRRTKLVLYRNSIFIAEAYCWRFRRNNIDIMAIRSSITLQRSVWRYDGWYTSISMFPFNEKEQITLGLLLPTDIRIKDTGLLFSPAN